MYVFRINGFFLEQIFLPIKREIIRLHLAHLQQSNPWLFSHLSLANSRNHLYCHFLPVSHREDFSVLLYLLFRHLPSLLIFPFHHFFFVWNRILFSCLILFCFICRCFPWSKGFVRVS